MPQRRILVPVAIVLVVALGVGLYLFQPWRLLTVRETHEALLVPTSTSSEVATSVAESPKEVAVGQWRSLEHATTGKASLIKLPGGTYSVQFAALDTSDGPDLHVYLSPHAADSPEKSFGQGFTSLGKLKGNRGDQVYEIPAGVDVSSIRSVVIWCRRFSAGFAVAPLEQA
ncbi:DM13 domain-containing protein [Lentzea sp. NPDC004782]|uniref:DM13 domain-containing protein n=1 Tax=Lentzea sp. NPDC004782 TaxID=3154458 RepID=UPI0033B547DE